MGTYIVLISVLFVSQGTAVKQHLVAELSSLFKIILLIMIMIMGTSQPTKPLAAYLSHTLTQVEENAIYYTSACYVIKQYVISVQNTRVSERQQNIW